MRTRSLMLLAAAAIGLAASQASAADLPRRAPAYIPPPPPPLTWTGCYLGGNIGGAFGDASVTVGGGEVSSNGSGFAGGAQVGCDYQFAGGWVLGIRNMFDWTSNNRSGTIGFGPLAGGVVNFNNQWFDTLTGRIGYAVQPAWLWYFQGGAAWAHHSTDITFGGVQVGQGSNTRTGWTIGGGVEWMFAPHWSVFLEGNWMDFGGNSGTIVTPVACPAGCSFNTSATQATVLLGVNYRFW
jgi:outer membrane immunogenic protein